MFRALTGLLHWLSEWRRFCALLVVVFVLRGLMVLSILPPFEGWDEYQHLAYIAYVVENGRSPVLDDHNEVPRSLYPALVRFPHSRIGLEQVEPIGAIGYDAFWERGERPAILPDAPSITLYQAQQAPLYYWLAAPVWRLLSGGENVLAAVAVLRLLNVCLGAGAVLIALIVVGQIVRPGAARHAIGLLIAIQPLFLLNCTRVANDALAVFLGTTVVALLLVSLRKRYWLSTVAGGVTLAAAILAKATSLALLPFVAFVFVSELGRRRVTVGRAAAGAGLLIGLTLVGTFWYFQFNFERFGVLTPLQEAVLNHRAGKTVGDLFHAVWQADWFGKFRSRCCQYSLWFGGWSWLSPPSLLKILHECGIYLAMIGYCLAARRRIRRQGLVFADADAISRLTVLCLGVVAGLAYHTIHTQMAWGTVATNSWYAAVAFPWLICLYYQGAAFYPGRARLLPSRALAGGMILIYVTAETYGTFGRMVPHYAGHAWGAIARQRLGELHPSWLGPQLAIPAAAAALLLIGLCVTAWLTREWHS